MSNTNSPNGFQFFQLSEGGSATQGQTPDYIASDYSTAIGYGDLVVRNTTTGYIELYTAASTTTVVGVFLGCYYLATAVSRVIYSPSFPGSGQSGVVTCYINGDPNALFVGQATSTAITRGNIGENIDVTVGTVTAANLGGWSTSSLNQSTLGTTSTLPFQIVGLLSDHYGSATNGTDNTSNYNRVIVRLNSTTRKQLTGTA